MKKLWYAITGFFMLLFGGLAMFLKGKRAGRGKAVDTQIKHHQKETKEFHDEVGKMDDADAADALGDSIRRRRKDIDSRRS